MKKLLISFPFMTLFLSLSVQAAKISVLQKNPNQNLQNVADELKDLLDLANSDTFGSDTSVLKITLKKEENLPNAVKQGIYVLRARNGFRPDSVNLKLLTLKQASATEIVSEDLFDLLEAKGGDEVLKDLEEAVSNYAANASNKTTQVFKWSDSDDIGGCEGLVIVETKSTSAIAQMLGTCISQE